MTPLKHELFPSFQVVNLDRSGVVNLSRYHVVSLNRSGVVNLTGFCTEIKKPIHFHCSRHTFATIGISSGIHIEVIGKLLGHNDLKTTAIYAKIMDDVKVDSMAMWGKKKVL